MSIQPISALSLGDQVWEVVDAIANVNTFRGRVTDPPLDEDGAVHAYAVLYEAPGRRYGTRACATPNSLDGVFQVTCVGGDTARALWCIDQVKDALTNLLITPEGRTKPARVIEDDSNISRNVLVDEDVSPARYFVPLLFRIHI